jgi:hypothetical protein
VYNRGRTHLTKVEEASVVALVVGGYFGGCLQSISLKTTMKSQTIHRDDSKNICIYIYIYIYIYYNKINMTPAATENNTILFTHIA